MATYTEELIGPEAARELLARNTQNRQLRPGVAERYAQDMRAGRWDLNGEDVIIAEDGTLLDGQHRLAGIILAGVPIALGIKRGVPKDSFKTIDAGLARTAGDVLALSGWHHTNVAASAARLALLFSTGRGLSETPPRREVTDYAAANPYIGDMARVAHAHRGHLNASPLAAVLFLANRQRFFDADIADFLTGIASGEGMDRGDPRMTLREWAINERLRNRRQLPTRTCFSAVARAWTAYVRGDELLQIKIMRQPHRDVTTIAGFHPEVAVPQTATAPAKRSRPKAGLRDAA